MGWLRKLKEMVAQRWRNWKDFGRNTQILRRFARNFSISASGSASSVLIAIGKTSLLTKTLSVANYGKVLIVTDLFQFLMMFLDVRVYDVIYRYYPEFRKEEDRSAIRGLLIVALGICFLLGLSVSVCMLLAAPWVANAVYDSTELAPLFQIYACVIIFSAFKGFYTPILRIHDRFSAIVIPEVVGNAFTLGLLILYLLGVDGKSLAVVVSAIAIGEAVRTVPPLIIAFRQVGSYFRATERGVREALEPHRAGLLSTLWQTNIAGYLKLGAEQGGSFLLGVLSTPTQVALYGIARQLVRPIKMLQGNVQTAIMPEVYALRAKGKNAQLYQLCRRFVSTKVLLGGIGVVAAFLLVEPVILLVTTPEYLDAVPVFYIMIATVYSTFATLVFYPLTVAMDKMKRRNLCVAVRFLYLGGAIVAGLDALKLVLAQFAGSMTTRLGSDLFLFRGLRADAKAEMPNGKHFSEDQKESGVSSAPRNGARKSIEVDSADPS